MARTKPKNLYPVKDLAAASAALADIAALKRRIAGFEASLNEEIDRMKAETEAAVAPLQAQMDAIGGGLLAYAEYNKAELFAKKRSVDLDFGAIGYRKSTAVKPKTRHTWAMILGRIKELGFNDALRLTETVNREVLHTWPDERLDLVGALRAQKDEFYYEIDETKIAEKAA